VAFLFHIYEIAKTMPNCVTAFIEAMGRLRHYRGRDFHSVQSRQSQEFPFSGLSVPCKTAIERERERERESSTQLYRNNKMIEN
jgi:hypothetical protein